MKNNAVNINPEQIMKVGMGFWASKTLLTAIQLELFTHLSQQELSGQEIQAKIKLHERSLFDFLDSLVAMGFLVRTGLKESALYSNAEDVDFFLDKNKPQYLGGMLEMANSRLYQFWNSLDEALLSGLPQNETKNGGKSIFEIIYSNPLRLEEFVRAMGSLQMGNFIQFSNHFDFSKYKSFCDLGGAGGYLSAVITNDHPHLKCTTYDLPPIAPIAKSITTKLCGDGKVTIKSGDFFHNPLPKSDIITMGNVLHDWSLEDKKKLMRNAYQALPNEGVLVVIENIIDDERKKNVFGLLMSLNMLIETPEGFDFSFQDFSEWAEEIGFRKTEKIPLAGPSSAVLAFK